MAISAYIFIESTPGKSSQVAQSVARLPGVQMAHSVTGSYDIIALVQAEDVTALGQFITGQIHRLPGVVKTTTNVVVG
jgi:DNA-binding Lrp family transcriptional regulator